MCKYKEDKYLFQGLTQSQVFGDAIIIETIVFSHQRFQILQHQDGVWNGGEAVATDVKKLQLQEKGYGVRKISKTVVPENEGLVEGGLLSSLAYDGINIATQSGCVHHGVGEIQAVWFARVVAFTTIGRVGVVHQICHC